MGAATLTQTLLFTLLPRRGNGVSEGRSAGDKASELSELGPEPRLPAITAWVPPLGVVSQEVGVPQRTMQGECLTDPVF